MKQDDIMVIGAGPAGLSACFYADYYGLNTIIFEEKNLGGEAAEIPFVENYPGCDEKMTGKELTDRMVRQCEEKRGEIHQFEKVMEMDLQGNQKIVKTDKGEYSTKYLIIASGTHPRVLEVPGENQFRGRGVSYCAVCDGAFFKNKRVVVMGGDNRAAEVAVFLSGIASDTKLICHENKLCSENILVKSLGKHNVEVIEGMELEGIKGEVNVKSIVLSDKKTQNTKEIETDGVFFQLEGIPNCQIAKESGVKVNDEGYIIVDEKNRTNIKNVYAAGDVTDCAVKLVSTAVAHGAAAVLDIIEQNNQTS
ncbi:MAG: FAD-dependent oxidoreductase [Candidatus Aminicenantes bacterium]|nr:FAD-dependent oxidoreductase [Candidatus Aminicenantes bacterium]